MMHKQGTCLPLNCNLNERLTCRDARDNIRNDCFALDLQTIGAVVVKGCGVKRGLKPLHQGVD